MASSSVVYTECIKEAVPDQPELARIEQKKRRECIKEAVPDQPERCRYSVCMHAECIKEAVPDQPERDSASGYGATGVYQRGRSRPARARRLESP